MSEREEFEKAALNAARKMDYGEQYQARMLERYPHDEYVVQWVNSMWHGWQARASQPAPAQGDEVTDDQLYDAAVEAWTTQTDSEWSTDGLRAAINAVREALSAQREQPKCDHEYVAAEKIGDDYVAECRKCGWAPARALLGQREG